MSSTLSTQRLLMIGPRLLNRSRFLVWCGFALILLIAPQIFNSASSVSFLSQLGALIIFCLSYNMLLGEAGMLSFCHAVFSWLGGFFAVHVMNLAADGLVFAPVFIIPLVGGFASAIIGVLLGYVTTKKSGTTFAMITLGIGELVYFLSQIFPTFFGGEAGVTTDRVYGAPFLGMTFGPQIQVYYLTATWLMLCTIGMYAFTSTPLGRVVNAVRDNAERAEFIGYNPRMVRHLVLIISSLFAGIAGSLTAINFEIASAESLGGARSAQALLFTFIGGRESFLGPIVGAVVGDFLSAKLSDYTAAWQLYLGIFFIIFVMYAPGGLVSIIAANWRVLRAGAFGRVLPSWLAVVASSVTAIAGAVILVELAYSTIFGLQKTAVAELFAPMGASSNAGACGFGVALLLAGAFWFSRTRVTFSQDWDRINSEIGASERGRMT
jgi:branched-chain amino acid transport system permease protein